MYVVISLVNVSARLWDNVGLQSARGFLVDADGNRREVLTPILLYDPVKFMEYGSDFYLKGTEPGTYTLVLEVKDRQNNIAKDSVTLRVQTRDINISEFAKAFEEGSFYHHIDWGWFGLDFTNGVEFDERQFSMGIYMMVNMSSYINENEWDKFMQDFRFEKQAWAGWDENTNGELDYDEFHKGLVRLELFKKWDLNNDNLVREDEFIIGIFDRWDRNRNSWLSREEYDDMFYTYLTL